jgi:hypothetical protein
LSKIVTTQLSHGFVDNIVYNPRNETCNHIELRNWAVETVENPRSGNKKNSEAAIERGRSRKQEWRKWGIWERMKSGVDNTMWKHGIHFVDFYCIAVEMVEKLFESN